MAEGWINCDAPRPADTAKFQRRIDALQALGVTGVRISAANSDYGTTPSSYDSTGIDAWVDLLAPTGLKCQVVLNPGFNYGHAAWIAVAGTYEVDFPSYNRPPIEIVSHIVSRDSSYWHRFTSRWVQRGGRLADLAVQIWGEVGMGNGAASPRETAIRSLATNGGFIGHYDVTDDWGDLIAHGPPFATGAINFLEAYVPAMDWSGTKVIAPSVMGHVLGASEVAVDLIHAAQGYTGAWPYLVGRDQDSVSDSFERETSASVGIFRAVNASAPWWSSIPEGQLEWAIEFYPGSEFALIPGLSPALVARVMKLGIVRRARAFRDAVMAARGVYSGAALTNLDADAPIHVVEWGLARGWLSGVDVRTGPARAQSESEYGTIIGRCMQALASVGDVSTASFYDLENRSSAFDVQSGYSESFGLMKSGGEVSVAFAGVAAALGERFDPGEDDPPTGEDWWSEPADAGVPVLA